MLTLSIMKTRKNFLFILTFFNWILVCCAQPSPSITVNGEIIYINDIDSLLSGTWYNCSNGSTTFLSFDHFLLFQYKSKGDKIVWNEEKQMYCTNSPTDTLLYKPIMYMQELFGQSIVIRYDRTNHQGDYDEPVLQYRGLFGNVIFMNDTLTLDEHREGLHAGQKAYYFKLPEHNRRQIELPDSGFTNKAEAQNLLVGGVKEGKWLEYDVYDPLEFDGDTIYTVRDTSKYHGQYFYSLTIYRHGVPFGISRGYDRDGKLYLEWPYINGCRNGIVRRYYAGKLSFEAPYLNDKLNGTVVKYYENGHIKGIYPYNNGGKSGLWKTYYENDTLQSECRYQYYEKNGVEKDYWEDGKPWRETTYVNGEKESEIEYYANGKIRSKTNHLNGKVQSEVEYYKSGGVKRKTIIKDDTTVISKITMKKEMSSCSRIFLPQQKPLTFLI